MPIPKVSQAKCYSFLYDPPRQHVLLFLLGMPLRHLGGWISIMQKCTRDLLSSSTRPTSWTKKYIIWAKVAEPTPQQRGEVCPILP